MRGRLEIGDTAGWETLGNLRYRPTPATLAFPMVHFPCKDGWLPSVLGNEKAKQRLK
jgi:hypothetical protein